MGKIAVVPAIEVSPEALGRLMPLYLWVSPSGHIQAVGPTLLKLGAGRALIGAQFLEVFEITRPRRVTKAADLSGLAGRRLHLALREALRTTFRGSAEPMANGHGTLINLSFGIGLLDAVRGYALTDADFAPTDLAVELLYLHEAKSAVMGDLHSVNDSLQAARAAAEEQALTDALTGLANRRALEQALAQAAENAAKGGQAFALAHLDLDFFKSVNDTHGHAAGDHALIEVARILRQETRRQDLVARVGGDEFVLILRGLTEPEKLDDLATRIIRELEVPMMFGDKECRISGSIGIALSPQYSGADWDRMLSDADLALYASKRRGRARCTIYSPELALTEDQRATG